MAEKKYHLPTHSLNTTMKTLRIIVSFFILSLILSQTSCSNVSTETGVLDTTEIKTLERAYQCENIDDALQVLGIKPDHINQKNSNDGILVLKNTRNINDYNFQTNIYCRLDPDTVYGIEFFITFSDESEALNALGKLFDTVCTAYGKPTPEASNSNRLKNAIERNTFDSHIYESWTLTDQTICSISAYPFSNPEEYQISIQYRWQPKDFQICRLQ